MEINFNAHVRNLDYILSTLHILRHNQDINEHEYENLNKCISELEFYLNKAGHKYGEGYVKVPLREEIGEDAGHSE